MRQEHRAGEKLFVDYAGQTIDVIDPDTGELRPAQIFVAVLGASSYTYAEATWTQQLPDWIGAHIRAFAFLGGLPEIVVPDNTRCAVTDPHLYEPDLNPTYQDLAAHYGVAIIPARPRRPRDKAKVEAGVLLVERWILACLRNRRFFSLVELNEAIGELLIRLNRRRFKRLPESRESLFQALDRPALRPLPPEHYEYAEWRKVRVHIDYHVDVDRHYYSVPYPLVRRELDARLTDRTVEVFHRGERVASHRRSCLRGRFTTVPEHMPPAHRHHAEWTPERLRRWAEESGPESAQLVETILLSRRHPQQGFRTCLGILRLGKRYGEGRLEAACRRANAIGARSYRSVASILEKGLDRQPPPGTEPEHRSPEHENVRGALYYR
jgi:transposase